MDLFADIEANGFECSVEECDEFLAIQFAALGEPKPKARPRVARNPKTGFMHAYTPDSTVSWEQAVSWQAKQAISHLLKEGKLESLPFPWEGRVACAMRFNIRRPKSLKKNVLFPMSRVDVDNLAKSVLDACQNVNLIKDDKIVTDLYCIKRFEDESHPQGVQVRFLFYK